MTFADCLPSYRLPCGSPHAQPHTHLAAHPPRIYTTNGRCTGEIQLYASQTARESETCRTFLQFLQPSDLFHPRIVRMPLPNGQKMREGGRLGGKGRGREGGRVAQGSLNAGEGRTAEVVRRVSFTVSGILLSHFNLSLIFFSPSPLLPAACHGSVWAPTAPRAARERSDVPGLP